MQPARSVWGREEAREWGRKEKDKDSAGSAKDGGRGKGEEEKGFPARGTQARSAAVDKAFKLQNAGAEMN